MACTALACAAVACTDSTEETATGGPATGGPATGGPATGGGGDTTQTGGGGTGNSGGDGAGPTGGGANANGGSGGNGGATGGSGAGGASLAGSTEYFVNAATEHDYGEQLTIPAGFGDAEFTMELWLKPNDNFPVGPVSSGSDQLNNWSNVDNMPYGSPSWWYAGNFLLDGHNNAGFGLGTFSLQLYGGGRLRWLFGDGTPGIAGGHWSIGAFPASSTQDLLDGNWHQVSLVRRFVGQQSNAELQLWIDGALVASETSNLRTNMRQWFDAWNGFPANQPGWYWGAEKQAAIGSLGQYEDFKGLLAEVRFWSIAKTNTQLMNDWDKVVTGTEQGLVGWFPMNDGAGTSTCDVLDASSCVTLLKMKPGYWASEGPPLQP